MDLLDGVDIRGDSEGYTKSLGGGFGLFDGGAHDLLQTRVHNIDLTRTSQKLLMSLFNVDSQLGLLFNNLQQIEFRFLLPLLDHSTRSHVIQILQPFEVRHGDTTSIQQDIGQNQNALRLQNLFTGQSSGTISGFSHDLALEFVGVELVDRLLNGGRDQDIARLVESGIILERFGTREALNSSLLHLVLDELLRVDAVRLVDGAVIFDNADDFSTISGHVLSGIVAHITETLDNYTFSLVASLLHAMSVQELAILQKLSQSIVHTKTS
mmetsp:Transcript_40767/g.56804  ORF Transcript_40767/g.56804 Transcript_40767/m.56804 type:complete len:268 (-) Transcript_40767:127-930(-)